MRVIFFRHGPAGSQNAARWQDDTRRPLSPRGIDRTRRAARGLAQIEKSVKAVVTSPLLRADQTAQLLAEALETSRLERLEALAPGGSPRKVVDALSRFGAGDTVVLVGHEPSLGKLAAYLAFAAGALPLKKAGACCIQVEGSPRPGSGELASGTSRLASSGAWRAARGAYDGARLRDAGRAPIRGGCSSSRASTARARARSSRCSPQWLRSEGYPVVFSEWNSSPIVKATTSRGKQQAAAHAAHLLADPRHRLLRPRRARDHSVAQGGRDRARRPLRLHRVRARRGARRGSALGALALPLRGRRRRWRSTSACRSRWRCKRILSGPAEAQVVRGGHGPGPAHRHPASPTGCSRRASSTSTRRWCRSTASTSWTRREPVEVQQRMLRAGDPAAPRTRLRPRCEARRCGTFETYGVGIPGVDLDGAHRLADRHRGHRRRRPHHARRPPARRTSSAWATRWPRPGSRAPTSRAAASAAPSRATRSARTRSISSTRPISPTGSSARSCPRCAPAS